MTAKDQRKDDLSDDDGHQAVMASRCTGRQNHDDTRPASSARLGLTLPFLPRCCAGTTALRGFAGGLSLLAGDTTFPLRWEEISMTDGKPLIVSITQKDGLLFLEFVKTGEGLWAEGAAFICKAGAGLEARIGQIRMGPAAHWILRRSMGQGRTFAMSRQGSEQLVIATLGWRGVFVQKHH
jgi:hypothetical protein